MTKKLIKTMLVCLCLAIIAPKAMAADGNSPAEVKKKIITTAISAEVDPYVVLSIAKLESNFDPCKKSNSGAIGVYQLMPRTAKILGVNPYITNENIKAGVNYYKTLYKKFGSMELALAAYNAGPGNVKKYGGVPPFKETKKFISKVKNEYSNLKSDPTINQHFPKKVQVSDTL